MREYALLVPVPVAELDPHGELPAAALIRLLQLAAARASADAGYDTPWYERNGTTWVVRSTRLQRLAAARHDDDLLVRTWVSDFRRVRSYRHYEIKRLAGDVVVANATTDWVYVDATSGAPAAVPAAIQEAFMPSGAHSQERPKRMRLAPDRPAIAVPLRRVELADLDALGHVNNARYVSFVEQALLEALTSMGWQPRFEPGAPHLRNTELQIEYLNEALYGQPLSGRVALSPSTERQLSADVEILADDRPAVIATGIWHWSEPVLPEILRSACARDANTT